MIAIIPMAAMRVRQPMGTRTYARCAGPRTGAWRMGAGPHRHRANITSLVTVAHDPCGGTLVVAGLCFGLDLGLDLDSSSAHGGHRWRRGPPWHASRP